jgi:hypothetical protein
MDNYHQANAAADDDNDEVETENTSMFFALDLPFDFGGLLSERDFMSVECFCFAS